MEWLKSYILTISCVGILTLLVDVLLPENNIKRFARFASGLVLSLAFCMPLVSLLKQADFVLPVIETSTGKISDAAGQVERSIQQMLKTYEGFENAQVRVDMDDKMKVTQVVISRNTEGGIVENILSEISKDTITGLISSIYRVDKSNIRIID